MLYGLLKAVFCEDVHARKWKDSEAKGPHQNQERLGLAQTCRHTRDGSQIGDLFWPI